MADTSHQPPEKARQQLGEPGSQAKKPRKTRQWPSGAGEPSLDPQQQPYDNLLKRLVAHQYEAIIRLLLRDNSITEIEPINIEMLPPIQRGDLIFRLFYQGEWHLLHFEFETSPDGTMDRRLHFYSSFLWYEYGLPVLSFLFYPFKDTRVSSPMIHRSTQRIIDTFHYTLIRTWDMDAREWMSNEQAVPFYGLLPTMEHLSKELLLEGIDRMIQFYQDDQTLLREELLCFKVMLKRAQRLSEADMGIVLRRIDMYDPLLEEDPWVQGLQAKSKAEGKAEGLAEGRLRTLRDLLLISVRAHFPLLGELAERKAMQTEDADALNLLVVQLMAAKNEQTAREILEQFSAS